MHSLHFFRGVGGAGANLFYPELGFRRPLEDPLGTLDPPPLPLTLPLLSLAPPPSSPSRVGMERGRGCEFYSWLKILAICKFTAQNHLTNPDRGGGGGEERKEFG
jgi:hypothetical protein